MTKYSIAVLASSALLFVAAASAAQTIESVWKQRASLAGKTVTVRGRVVKYTAEVLGVNWIHLQDGSGTKDEGTNDITVTSTDETKVGDTVTATGTVGLNKDLGSGYSYAVIIEKAKLAKTRAD